MNYARHFSGNAEAGSTASHYYLNKDGTVSSNTFNSNSAIAKEVVIGQMIETTLKDCGFANCKYYGLIDNKPVSYLAIDDTAEGKPGFYIYFVASYTYFMLGYCTADTDEYIRCASLPTSTTGVTGMRNTNSSANIFSSAAITANTYDTYIKVVGDTASSCTIYFASYGTTTFNKAVSISKMIDKRNNKDVVGFCFGRDDFQYVAPVFTDTNVSATGAAAPAQVTAYEVSSFTPVDNYIVFINLFCQTYCNLWLVDAYIKPNNFTTGSFYEIDGDIYYAQAYGMYKCTTEVTPST